VRPGTVSIEIHQPVLGVVDQKRLAKHVVGRNESPVAAVQRVVPIVPQDEVTLLGHDHLAVYHVSGEHLHGLSFEGSIWFAREVIAIRIDIGSLVDGVRLCERRPVTVDHFVRYADAVSGHSDDALHIGLAPVQRVEKDDDVAPRWPCLGHALNEDAVADQECVFHRGRRDHKCPHENRPQRAQS
jgi:hypothetical protein